MLRKSAGPAPGLEDIATENHQRCACYPEQHGKKRVIPWRFPVTQDRKRTEHARRKARNERRKQKTGQYCKERRHLPLCKYPARMIALENGSNLFRGGQDEAPDGLVHFAAERLLEPLESRRPAAGFDGHQWREGVGGEGNDAAFTQIAADNGG
jgi:hypothetical protein